MAGELNLESKAKLNGHPSICHSIQIWTRLKTLNFYGKWQNHFTHRDVSASVLLPAENLPEWKIEFTLPYLQRNFQINARNKLTLKCLLIFCVKNKLGSQIYSLVCKLNVCFIRLEKLVCQNNPSVIYTVGQSSILMYLLLHYKAYFSK